MSGALGALVWNKTVTLTNTQIKALPTTPIEVIPAPGTGRVILFDLALLRINKISIYTNIDAACYLTLADSNDNAEMASYIADAGGHNFLTPFLAGSADDRIAQISQNITYVSSFGTLQPSYSGTTNTNLAVFVSNGGSGNFTGGNSANTLQVTVFYRIIEL